MAKRVLFFVICCLCGSYLADAQNFYAIRRPRNLMVNFGSGIASYKGDLVNPNELGIIKPNITAGAEYYWKPHFSVKTQLTWFQIKGDDSKADDDRWERNLSFQSGNLEFALTGSVNLFRTDKYYQRRKFNIHAFSGIGVLYFNPKAKLDGEKYKLRDYKTEGVAYNRIQPTIPVGLGARIFYNHFFNILVEGGYRFTFTDYLDDASKKRYLPVEELGGDVNSIRYRLSDRRPEIDTQPASPSTTGVRGNPENNDGYFIFNISLQYYLPREIFRGNQKKLMTVKRKAIYRRK
jgi:hypothetical protein